MADQNKQQSEGSVLDDLLKEQEGNGEEEAEQEEVQVEGEVEEGQQAEVKQTSAKKEEKDPLEDLLATLNEAAGQQLGIVDTPAPQQQIQQPVVQQQAPQQFQVPFQTPVIERPNIQISQTDYDDAVSSPAGLARFAEKLVTSVLNAVQKPLNDGFSGVANHTLQNALTKTVETLTPVIDNRVRTQAVINEWWIENKDLLKARNLVGAAANRIAAKNPNISLENLLDQSGKEVRKLIDTIQKRSEKPGKKASFASANGTRNANSQGGSTRKNSIMAQLGMM